jgi:hypothetical protein
VAPMLEVVHGRLRHAVVVGIVADLVVVEHVGDDLIDTRCVYTSGDVLTLGLGPDVTVRVSAAKSAHVG